jgi:hypothetical protein
MEVVDIRLCPGEGSNTDLTKSRHLVGRTNRSLRNRYANVQPVPHARLLHQLRPAQESSSAEDYR